ncbi:hypothetical protein NL526_30000, partial [Klebsiella pneumoniae]|nr:hypothetical protein [Klebsiella pneumoniae]
NMSKHTLFQTKKQQRSHALFLMNGFRATEFRTYCTRIKAQISSQISSKTYVNFSESQKLAQVLIILNVTAKSSE